MSEISAVQVINGPGTGQCRSPTFIPRLFKQRSEPFVRVGRSWSHVDRGTDGHLGLYFRRAGSSSCIRLRYFATTGYLSTGFNHSYKDCARSSHSSGLISAFCLTIPPSLCSHTITGLPIENQTPSLLIMFYLTAPTLQQFIVHSTSQPLQIN